MTRSYNIPHDFWRVVRRIQDHGTYTLCQLSYDVGQRASIGRRSQPPTGTSIFYFVCQIEDVTISRCGHPESGRPTPGKALRETLLSARVAKTSRSRRGRKPTARAPRAAAKRKARSPPRSKPRPRRKAVKSARPRPRRESRARRVSKPARPTDPFDFRRLEPKWQAAWEKAGVYVARADPARPEWYTTVPYPYMNGYQHLGFGSSFLRGQVPSPVPRMLRDKLLHPQSFHWTGLPIPGAAERVAEREPKQWEILRQMGIPDR